MSRPIPVRLRRLGAVLSLLTAPVFAGTYSNSFNTLAPDTPVGAAGASLVLGGGLLNGVPGNATLISSRKDAGGSANVAVIKSVGGSPALRLADRATGSAFAALHIPLLDPVEPVTEFTVTLKLLMDRAPGATPADGFNLSFGPQLNGTGGSNGHVAAFGLVINFDTYQNATSDPRSIEVIADGRSVGNFLATGLPGGNFSFDQTFRTVTVHWDAENGLDLTYDGVAVFTRLPTPGFVPPAGSTFALNAATGGLMQDVVIDDLVITTVANPLPPVVTGRVIIEEIMADNATGLEDEDLERPDWIDLYNGTASPVNLAGWRLSYAGVGSAAVAGTVTYTLPAVTLPPFGHQIIFASGKNRFTNVRPHASFKLAKEGGTLQLQRPDGNVVEHELSYPAQHEDISFGVAEAGQTVGFLETASPGATNRARQTAGARVAPPVFFRVDSGLQAEQPSAVISAPLTLGLRLPAGAPPGSEIRYTLDLSEPSERAVLYTAPLAITTGTSVKARVFAPGRLPSLTGNRSFVWLSAAADTSATNLVNVATSYNGSGQAFSSSLPIIVLDSFQRNVDDLSNPFGLRPYRFTQVAVYDVKAEDRRASLGRPPDQMLRGATHVRGQSSSGQAERPYALEFWREDADEDRSEPLLGMPANSDWVLMSLTLDRSLVRNYLMQQAMLDANGPGAGVRCRYVEVFFNQGNGTVDYGDYRGVYLLMEKVARGKERVDVAKLNDSMSDPALLSGGFIFKADKTPYVRRINAAANAAIPGANRDYDIYEPEPVTDLQANALVGWLNRMTSALAAPDFKDPASPNYHGRWLDERSFIDRTLWLELCKEVDAYVFSYHFAKDRNGPLTAFPLWDVDRSLGNANYAYSNAPFGMKWWTVGGSYTYYPRLQQDPEWVDRYWNRWTALRRSHLSKDVLLARIESVYQLLSEGTRADIVSASNATTMQVQVPAARHFRKYPYLGTVSNPGGAAGQLARTTWRHEVDFVKGWLAERLDWLDGAPQAVDASTLATRLRPVELLEASSGRPRFGGSVAPGFQLRMSNPNPAGGTTYYTLDGPDPRRTGGSLDPVAQPLAADAVTATTLLEAGRTWRWLLPPAAPPNDAAGVAWKAPGFADDAWGQGAAPLGYGETTGLATNISPVAPSYTAFDAEPGPAYFRTTFTVTGAAALTGAVLEVMADDGAVVYLNGVEAARVNFPAAPTPVTYGQEASGPIDPGNNYSPIESLLVPVPIDPALLREGVNVVAVEVHQAIYLYPPNPGNAYPRNDFSDLRFDLRVVGLTAGAPGSVVTLPVSGAHTVRARVRLGDTWSPLTEATYVLGSVPAGPENLVVSELHYHPPDPTAAEREAGFNTGNDFEFIELMNISRTQAIDLTGVRLEDAVAFTFSEAPPEFRVLPPGGRIIVAENPAGFAARLQPGAAARVAGAFVGNFSNGGEQVVVRGANGALIRQFTYRDSPPWPTEADGEGASLILNSPASNPDHALASSWHAGTPVALQTPRPAPPAPSIVGQPTPQTVLLGNPASLSVAASGAGDVWYQWLRDGVAIEGANKSTLAVSAAAAGNRGTYTVVVGNAGGSVTSAPVALGVVSASALANLSVRTRLAAGQTLTLGAVVGGGMRRLLLRAAGPALVPFGLEGAPDPVLELYPAGATVPAAANDNWPAALAGDFAGVGAFAFPAGSKDAALVQSAGGAVTVRAAGNGAGVVLVEAYDTGGAGGARLVNLSARNRVGVGDDVLIAGFAVAGEGSKQLLIRAVGPTLTAFGVAGVLTDPSLRVLDARGVQVAANDNWTAALSPTFAQVGAFPLAAGSRDAALLVTLRAGASYTVQVSGVSAGTGEALLEIYEVF